MSKNKIIGYVILALVYIFPFRYAFLDYPENINVHGTMIDGGRMPYMILFLITVIGFLVFFFMTTEDGKGHAGDK